MSNSLARRIQRGLPDGIDPGTVLELLEGDPEWVLADRRVLELLLGPLVSLIVTAPAGDCAPNAELVSFHDPDQGYIWDRDDLCGG